jgi:quercetin 2,3-dioxygenase
MQRRKFLANAALASVVSVAAYGTPSQKNTQPFVVKGGQGRFGESTKLMGLNPNDIKVSGKDTNGQLTVFEYTGNTKGGPPLHIHPNQDEIFFIREGEYKFQVGSEQYRLGVGDLVFLPRNVPHTFAQLTETGKLFFFLQPSGKMEDYFRVLHKLEGRPSPEALAKIFADHDMRVVGPPITLD